MSHCTNENRAASHLVASSYDGTGVNLVLDAWPISIQLSKMSPVDARQLGLLLIAQASRCEQVIADNNRVRDIALEVAMATDESMPA